MAESDFANLDFEREKRCGFPEVIYAQGKEPVQVVAIARALVEKHGIALGTRAKDEDFAALQRAFDDVQCFERSRVFFVDRRENPVRGETIEEVLSCANRAEGQVVVACAGTSDLPVAEEAALTARIMGSAVQMITDVGVAGVHRVLAYEDDLRAAHAIVVAAGMEGALASLIGGLVDVPVIAVPTSVGYGANFGGLAALLGMLNSCAGGVSVVNIDNGFGAGQIADRINRPPERFRQ
ncbi:MAG: nickel pincer cofactor biosynthesis protein LarB [Coriobacteriales bacterium]|jgi:NCAIR mutase (PurE)-related protein